MAYGDTLLRVDSLDEMDLCGQRVFLRCELNVKTDEGQVKDDTRLHAVMATVEHLVRKNAKVIIGAHRGRPQKALKKGADVKRVAMENSLLPVAARLEHLLSRQAVHTRVDCIHGIYHNSVESYIANMAHGDVLLLGNLRMLAAEEYNERWFVDELAKFTDVYVNEAIGAAHRAHASTAGLAYAMFQASKPMAIGFNFARELALINEIEQALKSRDALLVIGGVKLKEKLEAAAKIGPRVRKVLLGGACYNVVQAARGYNIGQSVVEDEGFDYTERGGQIFDLLGSKLVLPRYARFAPSLDSKESTEVDMEQMLDPKFAAQYQDQLIVDLVMDDDVIRQIARPPVVIFSGPINAFDKGHDQATPVLQEPLRDTRLYAMGGESADAYAVLNPVVLTGGGSSLEALMYGKLATVEAMEGKADYAS